MLHTDHSVNESHCVRTERELRKITARQDVVPWWKTMRWRQPQTIVNISTLRQIGACFRPTRNQASPKEGSRLARTGLRAIQRVQRIRSKQNALHYVNSPPEEAALLDACRIFLLSVFKPSSPVSTNRRKQSEYLIIIKTGQHVQNIPFGFSTKCTQTSPFSCKPISAGFRSALIWTVCINF